MKKDSWVIYTWKHRPELFNKLGKIIYTDTYVSYITFSFDKEREYHCNNDNLRLATKAEIVLFGDIYNE